MKKSHIINLKYVASISGLGLLALVSGQASAYICTGAGNDLVDPLCDDTEISAALGMPFDDTLLAKDDDPLNPGSGTGGSTDFGTLEVVLVTDTIGGEVRFTYTGVTPQVIVEKAARWYSVYDWETQILFNEAEEYYFFEREFSEDFNCDKPTNCTAETSHVSAYGVVPIPPSVWLFGLGLLGLIGIARRRKSV